ncbi:2-hydroxy-3-oxopropionate reductase [Nesterenkonia halophila]|uniref:2-hydroxy-3-oxopropionate reductase n=1 Tax=Nesterenkonia halophila TaxID=302044 RepID=UPI0024837A87|nr:2-hydroxy-3-oxopropionate reductase [Nesterenkonia halophila]
MPARWPWSTSSSRRPPSTGSASRPAPRRAEPRRRRPPPAPAHRLHALRTPERPARRRRHPARDPSRGLELMSKNIAVIGLGIMGLPMATNLVGAGFAVTGYNRSPEKTRALAEAGGTAADSIAQAVAGADVIITMVPDSPDVEAVLTGEDGILAHAEAGAHWIDASTIRPDTAIALAAQAREAGLKPLDAPVSGGEQGAIDAALSIMVGGEQADVDAVQDVLDAIGRTIVRVGPSGSGQTVKAANQLIVAVNIQALAEAVGFLEAYGVDTDAALQVLGGGLAGSKVLDQKGRKMLDRSFDPGFRLQLHHKDMGIVTSAAREAGVATPLAASVAQLVAATVQQGNGHLDHSGLFTLVEQLSAVPAETAGDSGAAA